MAPKRPDPPIAGRTEGSRFRGHTPTGHHNHAPHAPTVVPHGSFHPRGNQRRRRRGTIWWTNGPNEHFVDRTFFAHDDVSVRPQYRTLWEGEMALVCTEHPVAEHPTLPEKTAFLDVYSNPTETDTRVERWYQNCSLRRTAHPPQRSTPSELLQRLQNSSAIRSRGLGNATDHSTANATQHAGKRRGSKGRLNRTTV